MVICNLCGEDVPEDEAGMGQTLKVVHEHEHSDEKRKLGMTMMEYIEYCKTKRISPE